MQRSNSEPLRGECNQDGPRSTLENELMEKYLRAKGYSLAALEYLPEEKAKALHTEACLYASLKLAEIESRAGFGERIHHTS